MTTRGNGHLVELAVLRHGTSQSGRPYYSGTAGSARYFLFKQDDGSLSLCVGKASPPRPKPATRSKTDQRREERDAELNALILPVGEVDDTPF